MRLSAVLAAVITLAVTATAAADGPTVLLGANSIEYAGGSPPDCFGPSVLFDYGVRDTRARVKQQLAAMVVGGLTSLRVFFVYDYNTSENEFFMPAQSGRLEEPFRTNLINYL